MAKGPFSTAVSASRRRLAAALFALGCAGGCSQAQPPLTVVSLELDDTLSDQYAARAVLAAHGMRATFFVNSGRLDRPGYLTTAELRDLAADGNEIGGHCIDHPLLPNLPVDEQRRQICGGRAALRALGFPADDFAYPSGAYDSTSRALVQECGYESARRAGGLCSSPFFFAPCPRAESLPPRDRFATRLHGSIRREQVLGGVEDLVTGAALHGGGWVQLVFHHICDGCDDYSISLADLSALLDWLAEERAAGRVVVQTVHEVLQAHR